MACVSVCPPQAIKVDQANLEHHERAAGTFNEALAKGSALHHTHINRIGITLVFVLLLLKILTSSISFSWCSNFFYF
jgi:hypothetical protein